MARKAAGERGERKESEVQEPLKRVVIPSANLVSLYANDTQVQITPWDVKITFGEITELPTEQRLEITIKTIGEVRMSPQHAKRMAEILVSQLERYERSIGPIPMPKSSRPASAPNGPAPPSSR